MPHFSKTVEKIEVKLVNASLVRHGLDASQSFTGYHQTRSMNGKFNDAIAHHYCQIQRELYQLHVLSSFKLSSS